MAKSSVASTVLTSLVTTLVVVFGLRALEHKGVVLPFGKPLPPPPPAAAPPVAPPTPSGPVDVPSLVGMRSEQARELLAGRGCSLGLLGEREDPRLPAGTVAEQVPLPGSQLPKGAAVQAVLSKGAPAARPIPKVTGLRLRAARELLEQQGFKAGKIRYDSDGDRASGVILEQKPAPPATALVGTTVDLTVNEEWGRPGEG